VEGLHAGLLGDLGAEGQAEHDAARLAALREQRMLLRGILDEVGLASGLVAATDPGESWRSAAQREYIERLQELAGDLRGAARKLEAALDAVHASIATLTGR